jgi:chemotaxis protein MotA
MDLTTIGGIVLALASIFVGQALEGGHASSLGQATAGIIVLGGTFGATAVAFPMKDFIRGLKLGGQVIKDKKNDTASLMQQIVDLAGVARRDGVLALEQRLAEIKEPFLKRAVGFIVDGVDATVARDALEQEIHHSHEEGVVGAKVFESMGGYAPTVGILGAVLGLIHVMENLNDPSKLGGGIATAFVATVYGVGAANLFFLPMANKIKRKLVLEQERKTLIAEGVLSIQAGLNPRVLEEKLKAYAGDHGHAKKK